MALGRSGRETALEGKVQKAARVDKDLCRKIEAPQEIQTSRTLATTYGLMRLSGGFIRSPSSLRPDGHRISINEASRLPWHGIHGRVAVYGRTSRQSDENRAMRPSGYKMSLEGADEWT